MNAAQTTSDRIKGDSLGVGHAKADRIPVRFSGKGRLSMRAIAKGHAFWRSVQVTAEDGPATRNNVRASAAVRPLRSVRAPPSKDHPPPRPGCEWLQSRNSGAVIPAQT